MDKGTFSSNIVKRFHKIAFRGLNSWSDLFAEYVSFSSGTIYPAASAFFASTMAELIPLAILTTASEGNSTGKCWK
jgi:hypothetical protein